MLDARLSLIKLRPRMFVEGSSLILYTRRLKINLFLNKKLFVEFSAYQMHIMFCLFVTMGNNFAIIGIRNITRTRDVL